MHVLPYDVEVLRAVLLYLETRQVSPRTTVIIVLREEARDLTDDARELCDGLNLLRDLDYIEGPGADADDIWLFRKLRPKGVAFVKAARDPEAWDRMKRRHAIRTMPQNRP
jgi:hypothetical protein